MHTTNYINTFIEIAEDCKASHGLLPPVKGDKLTLANLQFNMIYENPYKYTSDEVLFGVFATRQEFTNGEMDEERKQYFSKGQPCFRASPLTKTYGWGIHNNEEGKIAMFGSETKEYSQLINDHSIKKVKAMKSSRK